MIGAPRFVIPVFLLLAQHLSAATSAQLLDQLRDAIRQEQPAKDDNREATQMRKYALAQLEVIDLSNESQVQQLVASIASVSASEGTQKLVRQLSESLRTEREQKAQALAQSVDESLKAVGPEVMAAKTPKDIDPILERLAAVRSRIGNSYSESTRLSQERLESAVRFVMQWQDYLAKLESGDDRGAFEVMQGLSQNYANISIVPRSELLSRARRPAPTDSERAKVSAQTDEIVASIHKLDDLDAGIRKLRLLKALHQEQMDYDIINKLLTLQRSYLELSAGLASTINVEDFSNSYPEVITPLKAQLLRLALPRYIGTDIVPQESEPPVAYLDRVAQQARAAEDWHLLGRTMDARKLLARNQYSGDSGIDSQAWTSFQTATNQEKAGQYELATRSYQDSLRGTGTYVPVEYVGERLKSIERDHPEAYKAGTQPRQSSYPPGFPATMMPPMQRAMPPPRSTPLPTDLQVPAAKASPGKPKS